MILYIMCAPELVNVLVHAFKLMDFIRIDSVLVFVCFFFSFSLLSFIDRYYINTINTYIFLLYILYTYDYIAYMNCVQFLNKLYGENGQKIKQQHMVIIRAITSLILPYKTYSTITMAVAFAASTIHRLNYQS